MTRSRKMEYLFAVTISLYLSLPNRFTNQSVGADNNIVRLKNIAAFNFWSLSASFDSKMPPFNEDIFQIGPSLQCPRA